MIIVEENFNILSLEEENILKEKCDNFILSETPVLNSPKLNYYNRFTLHPGASDLKSISKKILSYTKEKIKSYDIINNINDEYNIEIGRFISINKIDTTSNTDDAYHFDGSDATFILYLNDDFEGGEFEYIDNKNNPIKIKPKKNLVIISNNKLEHRVLPVLNGIRYSLIYFFDFVKKKDKTLI